MGSLRLSDHHFQQLSKQRQDIGLTIQLPCPLKPFLHPGSWRIRSHARAQAVSTPNFYFVGYTDSPLHNKQSYTHPLAHEPRFLAARGALFFSPAFLGFSVSGFSRPLRYCYVIELRSTTLIAGARSTGASVWCLQPAPRWGESATTGVRKRPYRTGLEAHMGFPLNK